MMAASSAWSKVVSKGRVWEKVSLSTLFWAVFVVVAALIGGTIGLFGQYALLAMMGVLAFAFIIIFRWDEFAVVAVIMFVRLYLDWYVGLAFGAILATIVLLCFFFFTRSSRYSWAEPRALWLWGLFLAIAILPATHGLNALDSAYYYFNVIFSAFIMFWLGCVIARGIQRFFSILAFFSTFLAVHTIIQASTGVILLESRYHDPYLLQDGVSRAGSFLINPDSNGTLFAVMLFIPLTLFIESPSLIKKILYLLETVIILIALLATYSTGAWAAAGFGLAVFVLFIGRSCYRVYIPMVLLLAIGVIVIGFPTQISLLIKHASDPSEILLRSGAWQTGLRVIQAFPLTGIGLGRYIYVQVAEAYRVPAQFIPLGHPHNSYIELAALGGIPLLIVFIMVFLVCLKQSLVNWKRSNTHMRSLIAGGLATIAALSFNGMINPTWTLAPFTAIGWLIFGVIASPLINRGIATRLGGNAIEDAR